MKHCIRVVPAVCLLCLLVFASAARAQAPQPFSADFTTNVPQQGVKKGRIFFSAPKMRMDMTMPPTGGPFGGDVSLIVDGGTHTSYMLLPQAKMYMEIHAEGANDIQGVRNLETLSRGGDLCKANPGSTCKKVGAETVNGRSCDKWEMIDKNNHKSTLWIDQKLYAMVRLQEYDGTLTDLTNIKEGAQNASLFVVPPGYRAFDPSAMGGPKR